MFLALSRHDEWPVDKLIGLAMLGLHGDGLRTGPVFTLDHRSELLPALVGAVVEGQTAGVFDPDMRAEVQYLLLRLAAHAHAGQDQLERASSLNAAVQFLCRRSQRVANVFVILTPSKLHGLSNMNFVRERHAPNKLNVVHYFYCTTSTPY